MELIDRAVTGRCDADLEVHGSGPVVRPHPPVSRRAPPLQRGEEYVLAYVAS